MFKAKFFTAVILNSLNTLGELSQLTALPQILSLDFRDLLLREGNRRGKGRDGSVGERREGKGWEGRDVRNDGGQWSIPIEKSWLCRPRMRSTYGKITYAYCTYVTGKNNVRTVRTGGAVVQR